jgi:hypothetical protein
MLFSGLAALLITAAGHAQTISPNPLTFGSVPAGQTSGVQQTTFTNTQSTPINIAAVYARGEFTQGNSCGATKHGPGVLQPGQSCSINVRFAPQGTGARPGMLYVATDASSSPQAAPLIGTGTGSGGGGGSSSISADFSSRSGSSPSIAPNFIGAGVGGGLHTDTLPLLTSGGINYTRFHAYIENVYRTTTPDWSSLDSRLAAMQSAGLHVILELDHTPNWLLPSSNPCPSSMPPNFAYPRDVNRFAQLAASFVTHIDANFPGVVQDYEIWNEPDGPGLCTTPNSSDGKLKGYLSLYAAVAPRLRDAARADGVPIRIGGPTLGAARANADRWISALLSNPSTAPYVDFVSFHYYPSGPKDVQNGMTWDGNGSLRNKTQASGSGIAAVYQQVANLVHRGSQPNASNTPIYLDEYNSDYGFVLDCCRNSPTYSPVWNSLVIADLLNAAYSGAQTVPGKLLYYAVSNPPFCLAGQLNGSMDCSYSYGGTPQAYPQYYALRLFADSAYLGLEQGGNMAASIQQSSSPNLVTTAFYNASGDKLVIVNTSGNNYSNLKVGVQNPGLSASSATLFTLNSRNSTIATESVSLNSTGSGYTATVSVPPYSVVALSIVPGS